MTKLCSYCNQKTPLSDEHVVPRWMTRLYPRGTWAIENQLTEYVRKSTQHIHLTVSLCEPCNTGWMSDLEDLTKPILIPLIEGTRTILSPRDQQIIKAWFCLRAMVYDQHSEIRAPRPRYFKDDEHHQLATTLTCYPHFEFFLGRYKGTREGLLREDHFDTSFILMPEKRFVGNVTRGYSMTFVFRHLVLQISCVRSPERLIHFMPDLRAYCFEFPAPFPINSFPPFHFTDKSIYDFVQRWSKDVKVPPHLIPDTP